MPEMSGVDEMNKYSARKTEVDGYLFDSQAEAVRYGELKMLEKNGDIRQLEIHPIYPLIVNGKKICKYEADFQYLEKGKTVVEDVKGFRTAVYRLKKKLMKAVYNIDILETN